MDNIHIKYDEKTDKGILEATASFHYIREHFSVYNHTRNFVKNPTQKKHIPERLYVINQLGRFDVNFVYEIIKYCKQNGIEDRLTVDPSLLKRLYNKIDVEISETKWELRDYQKESIRNAFKQGSGINLVATGGGKTLIMATMIESLYKHHTDRKQYLILVPDIGLVEQTYSDFIEYGVSFKVSKYSGDNELDIDSDVIIANADIINERPCQFIRKMSYVFIDECHKIKASSKITKNIFKNLKTRHIWGFTGSLANDNFEKWFILSNFGRIFYQITSKQLRDMGYLSDVVIQGIQLEHNYPKTLYEEIGEEEHTTKNYVRELEYLIGSSFRNNILTNLVDKLNNNTLILVERLEQGNTLLEIFKNVLNDKVIYFISGETPVEERERIKQELENNDNVICIAMSSIFSTGISINNLHYLIFLNLGKSSNKVIQSIGRSLRKHKSKNRAIIFDIFDNLYYSSKHAEARILVYEKQEIKFSRKIYKET